MSNWFLAHKRASSLLRTQIACKNGYLIDRHSISECLGVLCPFFRYHLGTGTQTAFLTFVLVSFLQIHHYARCFYYILTFWGSRNTRTSQAICIHHVNLKGPNGLGNAQWLNFISQRVPLYRNDVGSHSWYKHLFNFLFVVTFLNVLYDIVMLLNSGQSYIC